MARPIDKDDEKQSGPASSPESTREALEFCFEDVSSIRSLGSTPLSDLIAGKASSPAGPAASPAPAPARAPSQRGNLIVLATLLLTLGAAVAATLLGR